MSNGFSAQTTPLRLPETLCRLPELLGDLQGHPCVPQPPMSLASLQNGPAQSRQIGTFGAGQPASAGGSHCSQGHQALVGRVGGQALDAVTHAFLLSLSSDLQRTGAGSPPASRPFPGSKEATVEPSRALGMVRSLSRMPWVTMKPVFLSFPSVKGAG